MTYVVNNADNEDLKPIVGERLIIGAVPEVNGDEALEIPEFTPTRHELLELVKSWTREATETSFFCWVNRQSGSTEIRLIRFASRRVDRIAELIGDDEVNQAVDTVIATIGEEHGNDEYWTTFQAGGSLEDVGHSFSGT